MKKKKDNDLDSQTLHILAPLKNPFNFPGSSKSKWVLGGSRLMKDLN